MIARQVFDKYLSLEGGDSSVYEFASLFVLSYVFFNSIPDHIRGYRRHGILQHIIAILCRYMFILRDMT